MPDAVEQLVTPETVADEIDEISQTNEPFNPVVQNLQHVLANSVVIFLNYKVCHWQASGPFFRDIHELFEEFAESIKDSFDEVAERLRMIGQDPIVALDVISDEATVQSADSTLTLRQLIEQADANAVLMVKDLRDAIHASEAEDEPGTTDMLTGILRLHEKHEWILRQMLKGLGGL